MAILYCHLSKLDEKNVCAVRSFFYANSVRFQNVEASFAIPVLWTEWVIHSQVSFFLHFQVSFFYIFKHSYNFALASRFTTFRGQNTSRQGVLAPILTDSRLKYRLRKRLATFENCQKFIIRSSFPCREIIGILRIILTVFVKTLYVETKNYRKWPKNIDWE